MIALLLATALLAAAPASQSRALPQSEAAPREMSDAEIRSSIEAYLGSIDTPIGAERWRALGPKAAPILEELAQDQERLPTRRARALEALSFVGSAAAPKLMVELAQREDEPPVVRMSAMRGAGRLLGPARLVAALKPILMTAKDMHVRAAAAEVLANKSPSAGCAAVNEQSAREAGPKRIAFRRAVEHCRAALDQ